MDLHSKGEGKWGSERQGEYELYQGRFEGKFKGTFPGQFEGDFEGQYEFCQSKFEFYG